MAAKLVHHRSEPVHDLVLKGMHGVSGTNVDVQQNYLWDVVQSQESAIATTGGSILTFLIPAAAPGLITLMGDSYIKLNCYFDLTADVVPATPTNASTSCCPALETAIFSDYEITINGTVVRPNSGFLTPYSTLFDVLVNENKPWVENRDYTGVYIWDTIDRAADDNYAENIGAAQRRDLLITGTAATASTRKFSLMFKLRDIWNTTDALPPGCEMRLRLTRANSSFFTQGGDAGTALPDLKIEQARVYMRRLRLTDEAQAALQTTILKEPARINFQRIKMFSQRFPSGTQEVFVNQALPGPRPSRVIAAYIRQNSLNGTQGYPAYAIRTEDDQVLSDIYLQLGDTRMYPLQAFSQSENSTFGTTLDLAQQYEMYQTCARYNAALASSQLTNISFYAFNTSKSGDTSVGTFDINEEVALDFHCRVSAAPTEAFSIMLFSWTDSVCEIDSSGAVTMDI